MEEIPFRRPRRDHPPARNHLSGVDPAGHGRPTVLGLSPVERLLLVGGACALGVLVGFFLPRVAASAVSLPWVPLRGPLELVAALDRRWTVVVCTGAGLVLGSFLAVSAIAETLTVTLTGTEIRLRRNGRTRTVARSDVDAVFLDGKRLVVLDWASRQVVRDRPEASAAEVERAFRAHGYPWRDRDPYGDLYRRWVPDTPDLPPSVNAVLAAREGFLRRKLDRDVAELRDEVQKLGFTVRDEQFRQYWRPLVRS